MHHGLVQLNHLQLASYKTHRPSDAVKRTPGFKTANCHCFNHCRCAIQIATFEPNKIFVESPLVSTVGQNLAVNAFAGLSPCTMFKDEKHRTTCAMPRRSKHSLHISTLWSQELKETSTDNAKRRHKKKNCHHNKTRQHQITQV